MPARCVRQPLLKRHRPAGEVCQPSNCQIVQIIAKISGHNLDEEMIDLIGSKLARIGDVLDEDPTNIISGGIEKRVQERLIAALGNGNDGAWSPTPPLTDARSVAAAPAADRQEKEKRKRGRPKIYVDKAPPTLTERSKQSVKALAAAGGKRVMLRLSPQAHKALKVVITHSGGTQETATINQVLIGKMDELMRASTIKL